MKLPRFTLRDLFWLLLVVAMGCAWWMEHRRTALRSREADDLRFVLRGLRYQHALSQTAWQLLDTESRLGYDKAFDKAMEMDPRQLSFGPGKLGEND